MCDAGCFLAPVRMRREAVSGCAIISSCVARPTMKENSPGTFKFARTFRILSRDLSINIASPRARHLVWLLQRPVHLRIVLRGTSTNLCYEDNGGEAGSTA